MDTPGRDGEDCGPRCHSQGTIPLRAERSRRARCASCPRRFTHGPIARGHGFSLVVCVDQEKGEINGFIPFVAQPGLDGQSAA